MPRSLESNVYRLLQSIGLGFEQAVVVGLSGGADSLALTSLLAALRAAGQGPRLHVVHVDHGLRPESAADAERVVEQAARLGLPVEVVAVDVAAWREVFGEGEEAAARDARYAALAGVAARHGIGWLAVAHTRDDQAETALLRLARGASLEGLAGMRPVARRRIPLDPHGAERVEMRIARPLLDSDRAEILDYLARQGLEPIEDPSNRSPRYARNAIRHQVLPALERLAPGSARAIARTARSLADDADLLAAMVEEAAGRALDEREGLVLARRGVLAELHPALARRVLLSAARRLAGARARLTLDRIEALHRLARAGAVSSMVQLGSGLSAIADYDVVAIGPEPALVGALRRLAGLPELDPQARHTVRGECELRLGHGWRLHVMSADPGREVAVRTRRPGDRWPRAAGDARRLQDVLVDHKVPAYARDRLPLVTVDGEVRWVAGVSPGRLELRQEGVTIDLRRVEAGSRMTEEGRGLVTRGLQDIALHRGLSRILIDEETLSRRVAELGREIGAYYASAPPRLVGVLTGGFIFMADLARAMAIPLRVDFMAVSSYGDATETSGVVRILKDLERPIAGERILVVEDIVDSGLTLSYLIDVLRRRNPAEVRIVALLNKMRPREKAVHIDWVGFEIPDEFVVGYGLDVAGKYRNLPFIAVADAAANGA